LAADKKYFPFNVEFMSLIQPRTANHKGFIVTFSSFITKPLIFPKIIKEFG
jgi:hypothetical protein